MQIGGLETKLSNLGVKKKRFRTCSRISQRRKVKKSSTKN